MSFEVGRSPLLSSENRSKYSYFLREYNVLSAVTGLSQAGYMVQGPTDTTTANNTYALNSGSYMLELVMRCPSPMDKLLTIEVSDSVSGATLASDTVNAADFEDSKANTWVVKRTAFTVAANSTRVAYKVYWNGQSNVDLSVIRIKQSA